MYKYCIRHYYEYVYVVVVIGRVLYMRDSGYLNLTPLRRFHLTTCLYSLGPTREIVNLIFTISVSIGRVRRASVSTYSDVFVEFFHTIFPLFSCTKYQYNTRRYLRILHASYSVDERMHKL